MEDSVKNDNVFLPVILMVVVTKSSVLTVGVSEKADSLKELPIQILTLKFGNEAVSSLKSNHIDGVISKWDLPDMKDGRLLKGIKSFRPDIPTIAIVESDNPAQEIAARSLGVSAVLTDHCSAQHFIETVSQILGLDTNHDISSIYANKSDE